MKRFRHDELARAETEQREAQPDDELRLKYDGRGLLVTEENRAGKHGHEYDPLGNLLTTTLPDGRRTRGWCVWKTWRARCTRRWRWSMT
ncbi:TPA: RHS repeat domain-containing protein [Salmonella enterica subsp. enterica]